MWGYCADSGPKNFDGLFERTTEQNDTVVFSCNRLNSATEESLFLRDPVDAGQFCGVMKLASTFFYSLSKMRWCLGSRGWCIRRMNREDMEKRRELLLLRLTRWCGDYWMECTRCVRQHDAAIYTPYLDFSCNIHHILTLNVLSELPFTLLICFFPRKILVISIVDEWLIPVIWCLQFFHLFAFVWWNLRLFLRTRMLASPIWHFTSWRISPWKCFSSPLHPLLAKP